ncbi:hypothetical protein GUJ93_ZPchr0001g29778 [Zizania palustris]|uniref:peptidyl-tRNA hydrolase n=1 Tax=Zizania palustris TaxID=103762 RepID=A0A8J5V9A3_ZIZPA|nr:hypothetical protein GUJ93_ZPchr0001g29778 [Zizania palustris]KAG8055771.1 hypothetical protein GUJ93_ZPchr0001g29778 [Zizania palustris]
MQPSCKLQEVQRLDHEPPWCLGVGWVFPSKYQAPRLEGLHKPIITLLVAIRSSSRAAVAAAVSAMRLLSGASASRIPCPLLSFARAKTRFLPVSASGAACRAASSSGAGAGDGGAQKPWLFVGLGNPGKAYQGTRHNVGFEMIDVIAEAEGVSVSSMQFKAMVGKGRIGDAPVMLAKPQTFMNASGESVGQLVSYFKIPLNQVLVMYDDLDLPFAKLHLLPKGGHGGHNGYSSSLLLLRNSRSPFPIYAILFQRSLFYQL